MGGCIMSLCLYDIQDKTVKKIIENNYFAIFNECGTGKTITMLYAMKCIGKKFLVVAPLSVIDWWVQEAKRLDMKIVKIYGKNKIKMISEVHQCDGFVTNYDSLRILKEKLIDFVKNNNIEVLICDESTYFKHRNQRFKVLRNIIHLFNRRYILTGTPITNSLQDIWSQIYIVDGGQRLGPYYTRFLKRYFYLADTRYFKYQPYHFSADDIAKRIKDINVRYTLADIREREIPEGLVYMFRYYIPSTTLQKAYDTLYRECILKIKNNEIAVASTGALFQKMLELSSGFIYDNQNKTIYIDNDKFNIVKDVLDNELYGKQVVVFYNYNAELNLLKSEIKNCRWISVDRDETIKDFKNNKFRVLLAHSRTMGFGVNLQNAYAIVWSSPPLSLEVFQQANSRVFRLGQINKKVPCFLISSIDMLDNKVYSMLQKKENVQEGFLKIIKEASYEMCDMSKNQ